MTTAVQRRRGTNTEHATFTGLDGEITVNTTTYTLHVHDGATVGGVALAKADGSNLVTSSIDINGGTIDGTVIGGSSAAAGTFTNITGTSANINGTVTADGLTVNATQATLSNDGSNYLLVERTTSGSEGRLYVGVTSSKNQIVSYSGTSGTAGKDLTIEQGNAIGKAVTVHSNNDISFYEDTGTTAKFFWDASAESLTVPALYLDDGLFTSGLAGSASVFNEDGTTADFRVESSGNTHMLFVDGGLNAVGIGTSSPASILHLRGAAPNLRIENTDGSGDLQITHTGSAYSYGGVGANQAFIYSNDDVSIMADTTHNIKFHTNSAERARLDASGNLLVGKTSLNGNTAGFQVEPAGAIAVTRSGSVTAYFNRQTSDGDIAVFRKDGTTVGSIGSSPTTSQTYFAGTSRGVTFGSSTLYPCSNIGSGQDAQLDIGSGTYRFKDLYLSGGVYLGGTGAANLLDDYEIGTWDPIYVPISGAFGTITYDVSNNVYVKIGEIVHCQCILRTDSLDIGTASGGLKVGGLPFNVQNFGSGGIGYAGGFSGDHPLGYQLAQNTTEIVLLYRSSVNGASLTVQAADLQTGATGNANYIMLNFSYRSA